MDIKQFTQTDINGHTCYASDPFMIVQNNKGTWNAYNNGTSVVKEVIRQDLNEQGDPVDVLGAKEYITPEEAALDCL